VIEAKRHIPDDKDLSEIPDSQKRPQAESLDYFSKYFTRRDKAICMAHKIGSYSMKQIAAYFGLHYSRVSRIIRNKENKAKDET